MNSSEIKRFAYTLGLDCVGIAPAKLPLPAQADDPVCPFTAGRSPDRFQPTTVLPGAQAVIVVLFPYYTKVTGQSNLSVYAQCRDYHLVVHDYLEDLCHYIDSCCPGSEHVLCVDTAPLADRWLAYQAGLGFFGDNQCFFHPRYGSYCYIGSIVTSLPLEPDAPLQRQCLHCGACSQACPGQCLTDGSFHYERCKSYLTQKKGELTMKEQHIIARTPLIFGCDECQQACPLNEQAAETPLASFRQDRLQQLRPNDITGLTNRQFKAAYGDRAFAWRGKAILLRNMAYVNDGKTLQRPYEGDYFHDDIHEQHGQQPQDDQQRQK
jgi:epoxyqueuosine reductase